MNGHGHDFGHEFVSESMSEADSETDTRFFGTSDSETDMDRVMTSDTDTDKLRTRVSGPVRSQCKKLTCFLTSFKNQLVLAKAFLPVYPTQIKPKPKSRKSRQLEMAANKPGQKSMKDFFNSSFSVKNEPGKVGLEQTLRVFLLKTH